MEWIVFDYAGVISLPPPEHAGALLPQAMSAEPERFWPVYWGHRLDYDLGAVSAGAFWRTVGRALALTVDDDLVQVLTELDLRAWNHVNPATLEILESLAREGVALALLSNAPVEMARAVDGNAWATLFRHRFFSADLRLAKPDPRIFRLVCERLQASACDVLFVDDREENVEAAESAGMNGYLFSDARLLREEMPRLREAARERRQGGECERKTAAVR